MLWRYDEHLSGQLVYMENFDAKLISLVHGSQDGTRVVVVIRSTFVMLGTSSSADSQWSWEKKMEKDVSAEITHCLFADTVISPYTVITCTNTKLLVHVPHQEEAITLDEITGATFSAVDCKKSFVVAGVSGFGYSILDGYRIRKYCLKSGKQIGNIIGSQCHAGITCLNYSDCLDDTVVVGCGDRAIRIHDFNDEATAVKINGINSHITTIQMDKWKVLSGHQNGAVCLWDRASGAMFWQSRISKSSVSYPVHISKFDGQLLTTVTIPNDKIRARDHCYDEARGVHKQTQGSIRVMDFTKDNFTIGVPDVCHAEYDDVTGYDYNIELIAPYDDVESIRLPAI